MELNCKTLPKQLFISACNRYEKTVGRRNDKQKEINRTKILMLKMKVDGNSNSEIKEALSLSHRLDSINGICAQVDWRVFGIAREIRKYQGSE